MMYIKNLLRAYPLYSMKKKSISKKKNSREKK